MYPFARNEINLETKTDIFLGAFVTFVLDARLVYGSCMMAIDRGISNVGGNLFYSTVCRDSF